MTRVYKRKLTKFDPSSINGETIIYINIQNNNVIITLTNSSGHVIDWFSSGSLGLRGFRKTSPLAAKLLALQLYNKTKDFGTKIFRVKVKGLNSIKKPLLKYISLQKLNIIELKELSMIPFNGCRPQKRRKL